MTHAAAEGRRVPASPPRWRTATSADHRVGGRHGDRQEAARRQDALLRGRRRRRQAGGRGERRVLRLQAERTWATTAGKIETSNFAEDDQRRRQLDPRSARSKQDYQWLITARTERGPARLPRLHRRLERPLLRPRVQHRQGLHDHRPAGLSSRAEGEVQVLGPPRQVRPGRHQRLRQADRSRSRSTTPRARRSTTKALKTDEYGGLDGELPLPKDATLGVYSIVLNKQMNNVQIAGGNSFRVEEYKKPEFEVKVDAPTEPVMLGEKINATIKAKYYFGAPVTKAKVKYKVTAHQPQPDLVSRRAVGLVLRPRLLVVRLRLRLVSRLRASGGCSGRIRWWWGRGQSSRRRSSPRIEVRDRPRRHGEGRDRHGDRQGAARRPGPQYTITAEVTRRVAADDRRHAARCSSPASRSRSSPGSTAATTASATRSRPTSRPRRSTTSRSRARAS